MKNSKKEIASRRILILFENAISNARNNPELSQRQAHIAKKIAMRFKIKMPWQIRSSFCKKCKKLLLNAVSGIRTRVTGLETPNTNQAIL